MAMRAWGDALNSAQAEPTTVTDDAPVVGTFAPAAERAVRSNVITPDTVRATKCDAVVTATAALAGTLAGERQYSELSEAQSVAPNAVPPWRALIVPAREVT